MSRLVKPPAVVVLALYALFRVYACVVFDVPSVLRCPIQLDTGCAVMTTEESGAPGARQWAVSKSVYTYCKWICARRAQRFTPEGVRLFIGDDYVLQQAFPNLFSRLYIFVWVLFTGTLLVALAGYFAGKRWAPSLMIYGAIPPLLCLIEPLFYLATPLGRFFLLTDGIGVLVLFLFGLALGRRAAPDGPR